MAPSARKSASVAQSGHSWPTYRRALAHCARPLLVSARPAHLACGGAILAVNLLLLAGRHCHCRCHCHCLGRRA